MSLVPDHIAAIKPYVPGKPMAELERELGLTSTIKLASNENPLGPSPKVVRALRASLGEINRYPDGGAFELTRARNEPVVIVDFKGMIDYARSK